MEPITRLEKYLAQIVRNTSGAAAGNPLILYADKAEEYDTNPAWGDKALKAIQEGRQILVRVPNADGGNHTAIYSPVLTYQLPNYENDYLYLFYLRDEKQDLSALLGVDDGTVQMPTYGELQMKLSEKYNGSPLGQPYINNSPAVGGSVGAKPVFFITKDNTTTLYHYDNPTTPAAAEALVDAYLGGCAYIVDEFAADDSRPATPSRIVGFKISNGIVGATAYNGFNDKIKDYAVNDSETNIKAAFAKYLP